MNNNNFNRRILGIIIAIVIWVVSGYVFLSDNEYNPAYEIHLKTTREQDISGPASFDTFKKIIEKHKYQPIKTNSGNVSLFGKEYGTDIFIDETRICLDNKYIYMRTVEDYRKFKKWLNEQYENNKKSNYNWEVHIKN